MKEIITTESILGKQVSYRGEECRSHLLYVKGMLKTRNQQDARLRMKKEKMTCS